MGSSANSTMDFQNRSLQQQGYAQYSESELNSLRFGLRFTPTVCMIGAVFALVYQLPNLHFGLAVLGIAPMWLPAAHPLDLIYNSTVRRWIGGVKLPPNPLPRRIACFMGGSMNIAAGVSFVSGMPNLAYVFGGTLIVLQLVVNTTHFCLASWMWEGFLRLIGKWESFATSDDIAVAIKNGATIVDVRDPHEFEEGHLENAINIPLGQFELDATGYKDKDFLLYCRSGMRSQEAVKLLQGVGNTQALNMGSMSRASDKLPA